MFSQEFTSQVGGTLPLPAPCIPTIVVLTLLCVNLLDPQELEALKEQMEEKQREIQELEALLQNKHGQ